MTDFDKSNWAKPEFSQGYRDNADVFIVERRRMLAILQSFYTHFVKDGSPKTMLDLGCGDGIVTAVVADTDPSIAATLVDGSQDMLDKGRERLANLKQARYIRSGFQEIINNGALYGNFDFIVSSLAIHHLTMDGYFLNIDVVLAPSGPLEQWYLSLWKEWIEERKRSLGIVGDQFDTIIRQYKNNADNKPDTLHDQLNALSAAGFKDVDCYYKYGIFTMFGGRR